MHLKCSGKSVGEFYENFLCPFDNFSNFPHKLGSQDHQPK